MIVLQISKDNGTVQRELFSNEKNMDVSVRVFSYNLSSSANLNNDDATVYRFPFPFKGPFFIFPRVNLVSKHLQQIVDLRDIDIVHAHFLGMDGKMACDIKEKCGIPFVVTIRNTDLHMPGFWTFPWNRKKLIDILKKADGVIFLSTSYKEKLFKRLDLELQKELEEKSKIIPNGINDFYFRNKYKRTETCSQKRIRLLTVGDIVKNKNQDTVAKAVDILQRRGIEVSYTVVGKSLDKKMAQSLLEKGANLIDYCDSKALIEIYRNNDILVMPSFKESFGLVYAEALSQSMPVIYSKNEGFSGQFEEGVVGYGVDPYSAEDIASAVMKIVDEYDRLSQNAYDKVERFSWKRVAEQVIQEYDRILEGRTK